MEDQNQNMIPDKIDRLILRLGMIVASGFGAYATILSKTGGQIPLWLGLTVTLIPAALAFFSFRSKGPVQP